MMVGAGVSEELDAMKDTYFGLPEFLTQAGGLVSPGYCHGTARLPIVSHS